MALNEKSTERFHRQSVMSTAVQKWSYNVLLFFANTLSLKLLFNKHQRSESSMLCTCRYKETEQLCRRWRENNGWAGHSLLQNSSKKPPETVLHFTHNWWQGQGVETVVALHQSLLNAFVCREVGTSASSASVSIIQQCMIDFSLFDFWALQ